MKKQRLRDMPAPWLYIGQPMTGMDRSSPADLTHRSAPSLELQEFPHASTGRRPDVAP